jgi:hypothetical protein
MVGKLKGSRNTNFPIIFSSAAPKISPRILGPRLVLHGQRRIEHVNAGHDGLCFIGETETLANCCKLLMSCYFAFGIGYPRSFASILGFIQATCLYPITDFSLSAKAAKYAEDFCCI